MLSEASTTEISKKKKPVGFDQNKQVARQGGTVAGVARSELERQTGESVITAENAKSFGVIKQQLLHKGS